MNETIWQKQWTIAFRKLAHRVEELNKTFKSHNQILLPCMIDAADLDCVDKLASEYHRVHVMTEHTVLARSCNVVVHQLPHTIYGVYLIPEMQKKIKIEKDFNCFINRLDPIRQSWFYLLWKRKMIDRGFVSFNMHQRQGLWYPSESPKKTFEHFHKTTLSSFDQIYDEIKHQVPFKNFTETDNLCDVILATKFSIVIETYFERTDCKVFSEKTWRAIQMPRPFLLFAATGCLQKLRDMGFDVFDDYVDHGYDSHDTTYNCIDRQEGILSQAQRLMDMEITLEILEDWGEKSRYNRNILEKWSQNYQTDVSETLKKIERLIFE